MKGTWKTVAVLVVLWTLLPLLMILAIQESGTLALKKEASVEEILPFMAAVSMKEDFHKENAKAMAVIWRSNLLKMLEEENCTLSEVEKQYGSLQKELYLKKKELYELAVAACQETKGEILTYENQVCYCPFFALSSGITRDAFTFFEENEYPYLISVPSHRDEESEDYLSYYYFTREDFGNENIEENTQDIISGNENINENTQDISGNENMNESTQNVSGNGDINENTQILQILEQDAAGYVTWIKVGENIVGGEIFRQTYGLSSACFSIEQEGEQIRIICKGSGHGFGYSMYGGDAMAMEGSDYTALLKHYFPELHIEKSV